MPRVLAIETSAHVSAIALVSVPESALACAEVLASETVRDQVKLSDWVLPAVGRVLAAAAAGVTDSRHTGAAFDAIAFGAGPGSFTGVRTACATAQALAYAWQKPLVRVDSLEALAQAAGLPRVTIILDARMNEVYAASFAVEIPDSTVAVGGAGAADAADTMDVADAAASLPSIQRLSDTVVAAAESLRWPADTTVLGSGAHLVNPPDGHVEADKTAALTQRAEARWALGVALVAARKLAAGETVAPADAQPLYVRNNVALTEAERALAARRTSNASRA